MLLWPLVLVVQGSVAFQRSCFVSSTTSQRRVGSSYLESRVGDALVAGKRRLVAGKRRVGDALGDLTVGVPASCTEIFLVSYLWFMGQVVGGH